MRFGLMMLCSALVSMQVSVAVIRGYGLVDMGTLELLWPLLLAAGLVVFGVVTVLLLLVIVCGWEGYFEKRD